MLSSRVNIKEVSLRITGGRFQCFVSSLQTSQNPADGFSTLCEALLTGNDRMVHSEIIFSFIKWSKLCLQSKMSTRRNKRCLQSIRFVKLSWDLHVTNTNRPQDDEITVFYLNAQDTNASQHHLAESLFSLITLCVLWHFNGAWFQAGGNKNRLFIDVLLFERSSHHLELGT